MLPENDISTEQGSFPSNCDVRLWAAVLEKAVSDAKAMIKKASPENHIWRQDVGNLLRWFRSKRMGIGECAWICDVVGTNHEFFSRRKSNLILTLEAALDGKIKPKPKRRLGGARTVNAARDLEIGKRYLAGEKLKDLGEEYGVTVSRISRIGKLYMERIACLQPTGRTRTRDTKAARAKKTGLTV